MPFCAPLWGTCQGLIRDERRKLQAPSSKHQAPSTREAPIFKLQLPTQRAVWCLELLWCLKFGAWSFEGEMACLNSRQFEQVFGEGKHGAVHALDLRIGRFDHIVFIRGVGAAAVAQAEMAGGQAQRRSREHEARPGAGIARPEQGLDMMMAIN